MIISRWALPQCVPSPYARPPSSPSNFHTRHPHPASLHRSFAAERSTSPFPSTTCALFMCLPGVCPRAFPDLHSPLTTRHSPLPPSSLRINRACRRQDLQTKGVQRRKFFRINTCKSVSKQRTYNSHNPFRINTYKKHGGGGIKPTRRKPKIWARASWFRRKRCLRVMKWRWRWTRMGFLSPFFAAQEARRARPGLRFEAGAAEITAQALRRLRASRSACVTERFSRLLAQRFGGL